ncbi:hypothetical protein ADUPG1_000308 [Aduncisulcus paluster]|uniref:RPA-interacting protein C-terminal domain-containing protein n=1 Tax=Aduncisulcus paluster TaxID=2918883 RepID=A0ABQ5K5W1_9EUKA|nr:hypothetical protein ADUPG1_000308 [Aduncisulcus paluster]
MKKTPSPISSQSTSELKEKKKKEHKYTLSDKRKLKLKCQRKSWLPKDEETKDIEEAILLDESERKSQEELLLLLEDVFISEIDIKDLCPVCESGTLIVHPKEEHIICCDNYHCQCRVSSQVYGTPTDIPNAIKRCFQAHTKSSPQCTHAKITNCTTREIDHVISKVQVFSWTCSFCGHIIDVI